MARKAERRLAERAGRYRAADGARVSFVSFPTIVHILRVLLATHSLIPPVLRRGRQDRPEGQHGEQGREEAHGEGRDARGVRSGGEQATARRRAAPVDFAGVDDEHAH